MAKEKRSGASGRAAALLAKAKVEAQNHAVQAFGASAMAEAARLTAEACQVAAVSLDLLSQDMSDTQREIALRFYAAGFRHGFFAAAEQRQTARSRGAVKAARGRQRAAAGRYVEYAMYYNAVAGTESQREEATAKHFGITTRTVRRAVAAGVE